MLGYLKSISSVAVVAVVLTAPLGGLARAKDAPPERLTIGYENEGKVDASWQACLAWVKEETVGWSKTDIEKAARKVCAARKRHVEAYEALQSNYRTLMGLLAQDVRLSPTEAAANLKIMLKACIDHKFGITTGGHNIMIDVIENEIAGKCLALGANLLRDEIRELR
jgi:hypothetical protein